MADNGTNVAQTLADALQKIENILSDDRNQGQFVLDDSLHIDDNDPADLSRKISNCAHDLRRCIENADSSYLDTHINIPPDTIQILQGWLQTIAPDTSLKSSPMTDELNCRQKVVRLENEKDSLLLQVSVLTDQVEVQGDKIRELELIKDEQQIKLAKLEEELNEAEKQLSFFQNQCNALKGDVFDAKLLFEKERAKIGEKETESCQVNELKGEIARRDMEIEDLKTHLETLLDEEEREKRLSACSDSGNAFGMKTQLREKASEVSRLKIKLERLTTLLNEKEKHIQELQKQTVASNTINDDGKSETSVNSSNVGDVFHEHEKVNPESLSQTRTEESSTLVADSEHRETKEETFVTSTVVGPITTSNSSPSSKGNKSFTRGGSLRQNRFRSSFGKGFLKLRRTRSISEPNLSPTDKEPTGEIIEKAVHHHNHHDHDYHEKEKKRNIVGKVFGKLRRSNFQELDAELKPHSNSGQTKKLHADVPFSSWSAEMVSSWLEDEGLGQYADACANDIQTGDDLLKMSSGDLEKVFGMKKILHRKKLHLALQAMTEATGDAMEHLDNNWVLDWLDDIGLPQYKDSFRDNIVDGRMLNYLTVNDALQLKVYSTFHQHCLRRAIQCLRIHNFHPNYLKKSPIDESWQKGAHVVLWTNHRVTEWLRQADLSEYATNLRGSGVHGSLMILEPRFTAESMATLLSIPVGKKLLRRHLATHFESLVGPACMKVKETALANGLTPLLPGEKHKALKKGLSIGGMRKRTKSDSECEEYVCPMDTEVPLSLQNIFSQRLRKNDGVVPGNSTEQKVEKNKEQDELTKSLGTFSRELNSLTDMLGQENSTE